MPACCACPGQHIVHVCACTCVAVMIAPARQALSPVTGCTECLPRRGADRQGRPAEHALRRPGACRHWRRHPRGQRRLPAVQNRGRGCQRAHHARRRPQVAGTGHPGLARWAALRLRRFHAAGKALPCGRGGTRACSMVDPSADLLAMTWCSATAQAKMTNGSTDHQKPTCKPGPCSCMVAVVCRTAGSPVHGMLPHALRRSPSEQHCQLPV